jgi:hypothetical protein
LLRLQPGHLIPDRRQPGEQLLDPRIPLRQQLPQPRSRRETRRDHRERAHRARAAPHNNHSRPQIDEQRTT